MYAAVLLVDLVSDEALRDVGHDGDLEIGTVLWSRDPCTPYIVEEEL